MLTWKPKPKPLPFWRWRTGSLEKKTRHAQRLSRVTRWLPHFRRQEIWVTHGWLGSSRGFLWTRPPHSFSPNQQPPRAHQISNDPLQTIMKNENAFQSFLIRSFGAL